MKISGLCGRLKCCLNYELEVYMDAIEGFPEVDYIETSKGKASLQKTDIFKRKMWFSYMGETTWYPMDVEEVKRIKAMNAKGEKPEAQFAKVALPQSEERPDLNFDFVDVVGTAIPAPEKSRGRRKPSNKRNPRNQRNTRGRNQKNEASNSGSTENQKSRNPSKPKGQSNAPKNKQGGSRPGGNKQRGNPQGRKKQGGRKTEGNAQGDQKPGSKKGPSRGPKKDNDPK